MLPSTSPDSSATNLANGLALVIHQDNQSRVPPDDGLEMKRLLSPSSHSTVGNGNGGAAHAIPSNNIVQATVLTNRFDSDRAYVDFMSKRVLPGRFATNKSLCWKLWKPKELTREVFAEKVTQYIQLQNLSETIAADIKGSEELKAFHSIDLAQELSSIYVKQAIEKDLNERENLSVAMVDLLVHMARMLRQCGTPAWRFEFMLNAICRGFGFPNAEFTSFPSFTLMTLPGYEGHVALSRSLSFTTPQAYNLARIVQVDMLAKKISSYATNSDGFFNHSTRHLAEGGMEQILTDIHGLNGGDNDTSCDAEDEHDLAALSQCNTDDEKEAVRRAGKLRRKKALMLDLASSGPGFFYYDRAMRMACHGARPSIKRRNTFVAVALEDAYAELARISSMKLVFPFHIMNVVCAIGGGGAALIWFSGSWWDALISFFLSFLIAFLSRFGHSAVFSRVYEFLGAIIAGFCSTYFHLSYPNNVCMQAVQLSAVVNLLQGVAIIIAIMELGTRNSISGVSRLFAALVVTSMMSFGLTTGNDIAIFAYGGGTIRHECQNPVGPIWYWIVTPITGAAFSATFQPSMAQLPLMTLVASLAWGLWSSEALRQLSTATLSLVSSFIVVVVSQILARVFGGSPIVPTLAGVVMLAPGALALRTFSSDSSSGFQLTIDVLYVSVAIGIGSFLGSLIVAPSGMLRFARKRSANKPVPRRISRGVTLGSL